MYEKLNMLLMVSYGSGFRVRVIERCVKKDINNDNENSFERNLLTISLLVTTMIKGGNDF